MSEEINYTELSDSAAEAGGYENAEAPRDADAAYTEEGTGESPYTADESEEAVGEAEPAKTAPEADIPAKTDYGRIVAEDIATLRVSFPELGNLSDITELQNPMRYAALRDLGLSAAEAYLATTPSRAVYDNRSHLSGAFPKTKSTPPTGGMTRAEWNMAKELFPELSDGEIYELYKKATE